MTTIFTWLFVALVALGCASPEAGRDRISTNVGKVDVEASPRVYFASVRVHSAAGATDVAGRIESKTGTTLNESGHISLTVHDADGGLLHAEEIRYTIHRRLRRPPRSATFHVLAPVEVPSEGRVRLVYHRGPQDITDHGLRE